MKCPNCQFELEPRDSLVKYEKNKITEYQVCPNCWHPTTYISHTSRPTREVLHMKTALEWSKRSLCKQPDRQVGCVITTPDLRQILAFGYNGPAKGLSHDACAVGLFGPGQKEQPVGLSRCNCLHAEINALIKCPNVAGKVCFVTLAPCVMCAQAMVNADVSRVFYHTPYRNSDGVRVLMQCGVEVSQLAVS